MDIYEFFCYNLIKQILRNLDDFFFEENIKMWLWKIEHFWSSENFLSPKLLSLSSYVLSTYS